ncbi:MAG TPA: cyclopropane-fatty-acyl-phospholipid synthase family protein [Terriglobales bacterium]|nr:cyclopropane-fatty-acyl-phospholipid synthase family protein [Terriglobales bacterium]
MALREKTWHRQDALHQSISFLDLLFGYDSTDNYQVRLWDGTVWGKAREPQFTLVLNHPGALRSMFLSPSQLTLGEAFIFRDFDVEGDIEAAFWLADRLLNTQRGLAESLRLRAILAKLPSELRPRAVPRYGQLRGSQHSRERDRQAVRYHYDLPPEFFSLFLDTRMVYSCAYFVSPDIELEIAQQSKLDYICRKLRLRPGERFLDIGCGWGALIVWAAEHYGVRSLGITLSPTQAQVANDRIRAARLSDRCQVMICDYRELSPATEFDKIASVGMVEHVGEAHLPEYFSSAYRLLRPGGVFLNHGIARAATYHREGPSFIDKYVFPDGDLPPINVMLRAAEDNRFEVRDVENLRDHYALTLHNWVKRLEQNAADAVRITDDVTYRIWRLYMAGSAHWFRSGKLNIFQSLLLKAEDGESHLPLTRKDWYQ